MVFLTPEGELKNPLYVSQKNGNAFEVREANGGKSDLPFSYRIVAKRKDIPGRRLERLDPKTKANIASMRAKSAQKHRNDTQGPTSGETPLVPHEPLPPVPLEPPFKPGPR